MKKLILSTALSTVIFLAFASATFADNSTIPVLPQWKSNGVGVIYTNATKVGIATTSPFTALSVVGNIYATGNITCGGTCGGSSTAWATTSSDYWISQRSTTNLPEGSNLYFTNARAVSALAGLYEVPLTFSTGLTRTVNTITVNTSQNISTLSNLTTNGFVKTSGGTGALSIDTNTYLTGNQTITLSGDITGSGTTGITTVLALTVPHIWTASTTFTAGFNSITSTSTNATSTNFFATLASTTNFFGSGLTSCTGSSFLQWTAGLYSCAAVAGSVTSVSNADGTLTISPTTGSVIASLNLAHANYWTALQNFSNASTSQLTATSSVYLATINGSVGIASTSPGSLFSVGNTNGINFTTGTTTFNSTGGIDLSSGCFSVLGTCIFSSISQASAYKQASNYATTAALPANTYVNGTAGVGATLTEVGVGALSVDGASPSVGQRILVKNESTAANNGIYTVTAAGSGIAAYVLTRATDFNTNTDVFPGVATYVISGTANGDDSFVLTSAAPITMGTTALNFTQLANGNLTIPISIANGGTNNTSAYTTGSVIYSNGTLLNQDNSNFFWDGTNHRLGLASTTPTNTLSVGSGIASSSITVAEYDYGKAGNNATSTAATLSPQTANQINWPIGSVATTLTLCNFTPGQHLIVNVQNPNQAAGALTWAVCAGSQLYWPAKTLPSQTTSANGSDIWSFTAVYNYPLATSTPTIMIKGAQTANF